MKSMDLALGRYDDPENQMQADYFVNLLRSNLAIFGSSMSGKSTLLKTILLRMHQVAKLTDKEIIYILDFGSSLKPYEELPYVAGYFDAAHEENVRRVFRILEDQLNQNMKDLGGESYVEARNPPPHVTFVLDGFSSFMTEERYAIYHDTLKKLAREGLSKGISVVIAASEISGFNRMMSSFNRIIAFDLPKDRYSELYSGKTDKPILLPGRGLANRDTNVYEFQAYLPYTVPKGSDTKEVEKRAIRFVDRKICCWGMEYGDELFDLDCPREELMKKIIGLPGNKSVWVTNRGIHRAYSDRKLKLLPDELTLSNWAEYCPNFQIENNNGDFFAGLDYYTLNPVPSAPPASLNLWDAQTIAIYGRKEFGKSNLLKLILEAASRLPNTHFCFWDDGRQALTKPEGLNKLIGSLPHCDYVRSREEFMAYLTKNDYLRLTVSRNNHDQRDSQADDRELIEEERRNMEREFRIQQRQFDEAWEDSFRQLRARMREDGSWTSDLSDQKRSEHAEEMAAREEEFRRKLNEWEQSRQKRATQEESVATGFRSPKGYLTVFVVQSRLFYQMPPEGERNHMIPRIASAIGSGVDPMLFVFSDVQRIESREIQTYFNNSIRYAFLLDDIVRFINGRGQNSVFGNQEVSELKERFGPCEIGDGFFFDIDRDDITKLKFIRSYPEGTVSKEETHG